MAICTAFSIVSPAGPPKAPRYSGTSPTTAAIVVVGDGGQSFAQHAEHLVVQLQDRGAPHCGTWRSGPWTVPSEQEFRRLHALGQDITLDRQSS